MASLRSTAATGLGLQAEKGRVTKEAIDQFKTAGYELNAWTIDDPALAKEYQALGFDSITTNRPALIRSALVGQAAESQPGVQPEQAR